MKNFFYRDSDYDLFRKALRSTKNEPVIINILSDDSSLIEDNVDKGLPTVQRKQMSTKFQASPFDKFFGPRKKRTDPLDMKDFSSWRNKNYRESEKQINETPEEATKFSFSDYLNSKAKQEKYNDEDQSKSDNQKSIDQLSSGDEDFKKFSLDSYLNKLEQETKVKKEFSETEDLFDNKGDMFTPTATTEQDENFMATSDVDVEDIAFGGVSGEKFAFEREELDSVKARLEKMEREANNIIDKPTTKVISTDDINEITGKSEDDEFDLGKLGIEDDIERVNEKINSLNKALQITGDDETETPKVEHKRFFEVNKNFDDNKTDKNEINILEQLDSAEEASKEEVSAKVEESSEPQKLSDMEGDISISTIDVVGADVGDKQSDNEDGVVAPVVIDGAVASEEEDSEENNEQSESVIDALEMPEEALGEIKTSEIHKTDEYLTKADFKDMTDEIVSKFTEMYRNPEGQAAGVEPYPGTYADPNQAYAQPGVVGDVTGQQQFYQQNSELQAKIVELLEQNKKSDEAVAEKLKLAEIEKQRVADQYEARLRELEASMKQQEEDAKQQVYIERLKNDIKFKKSESKYKLREEQIRENEKLSTENQLASEKLKSELKNYLNVSNLEMDKKLLECVNKLHKQAVAARQETEEKDEQHEVVEEVKRPSRERSRSSRPASRRRTSTVQSRMRTRTPRRKIDSDIIGGINFD